VQGKTEKKLGQFDIFNVMVKAKISFQSIRQYARFISEVTFSERIEANKVLDSPLIQNEELTKEERWVWKESRAVCQTFRTKELPPHVYFRNMKIEVFTFVAAVRQCYKCGKFGHVSKFCTKEKQCFSCGEVKHEGSCIKKMPELQW
jgi:hypothetical protein